MDNFTRVGRVHPHVLTLSAFGCGAVCQHDLPRHGMAMLDRSGALDLKFLPNLPAKSGQELQIQKPH
jgi:hypothetical protein